MAWTEKEEKGWGNDQEKAMPHSESEQQVNDHQYARYVHSAQRGNFQNGMRDVKAHIPRNAKKCALCAWMSSFSSSLFFAPG